jgi:membrane-bound serine protease (ClpP class)
MKHTRPQSSAFARVLRVVIYACLACFVAVSGAQTPTAPTAAVPASRQADQVVVITIHGEIDQVTYRSVDRRLTLAEEAGAEAVVIDLDTPGGLASAALEICTRIKQSPIRNSIAWVNPKAYSAGAFIALACREIVVAPQAQMGDAAPIMFDPVQGVVTMGRAERAKMESVLLAELVDSARRRGYDEKLVKAFVVPEMELWLVEHTTTGERLFVDRAEYELLFGQEPSTTAAPRRSDTDPAASGRSVVPFLSKPAIPDAMDEMAMTPEEVEAAIEAVQDLRSTRRELTQDQRGQYALIEQVVDDQTLLTINDVDMMRYGFAVDSLRGDRELEAFFGATRMTRLDRTWSEGLTVFLTSFWVRGLLIIVFLLGILIEMAAPGVGAPGIIAVVALGILIAAPMLTGMASWWEVAAILLGLVLVAAEIFIFPGLGVPGVLGSLLVFLGLIGTFVSSDHGGLLPQTAAERNEAMLGAATVLFSFFVVGVTGYFMSRRLDMFPFLRRLVLSTTVGEKPTSSVFEAMKPAPQEAVGAGAEGMSMTPLRPAGRARFGDTTYDVVAEGGFIEADRPIRIVERTSFRIVVEEVTPPPAERGA